MNGKEQGNRVKILFVNKFLFRNGGSETYMFKLGEELQRRGNEVQYFGMDHPDRIVGNTANSYTSSMDFHTGKLQKILYPFKIIYSVEARKKIRLVLNDFKPDVIHLNNFNYQVTPSIFYEIKKFEKNNKCKIAIIYTAHDYQWVCPNHMLKIPSSGETCTRCIDGKSMQCTKNRCIHNSRIKSLLGTIESYLYRFLKTYRQTDCIICPSEFMADILSHNYLLKDRITALHNFIDEKCENNTEEQNSLGNYVLYFGRYSEEKGIRTLTEVCRELSDIPFVFAGGGPLEAEVNQLDNIDNRGFLTGKELKDTIKNARFVVFPSEWYDNCPFTVMEALAYAVPVLASKCGGTPELIDVGKTGELFQSRNKEELKEKIERLWNDEEKCKCYKKNCKNINFDTLKEYTDKILSIYNEVLKQ